MAQTTYLLAEPVVTALVARLNADLPAALEARADGLPADEAEVLAAPEQVLEYPPPLAYLAGGCPAVAVFEGGEVELLLASGWGESKAVVAVCVYLTNPDQRLLALGLRRYMQAVTKVCVRDRALTDEADRAVRITRARVLPGDTLQDEADPRTVLSWAVLMLQVERDEE
jgi:hypothetical protein